MSAEDRKKALEAELVAVATDMAMADDKRSAGMAATRARLKRLGLVTTAKAIVDDVAEGLAEADDSISDETRISLMNKLREAINNIHEAS